MALLICAAVAPGPRVSQIVVRSVRPPTTPALDQSIARPGSRTPDQSAPPEPPAPPSPPAPPLPPLPPAAPLPPIPPVPPLPPSPASGGFGGGQAPQSPGQDAQVSEPLHTPSPQRACLR